MSGSQAYRHCEAITRSAAGNFYYGIRLLPGPKRRAMCAVYAFARRVDDIGDGDLPEPEKRLQLDALAAALTDLHGSSRDPVMIALSDATRRFELPEDALSELIEGVRMDVRGETYEDFQELVRYCQRVAGGIGRLCTSIFAAGDLEAAWPLADELGIAMQLTNILRDIREDAESGRLYIPKKELESFGLISGNDPRPHSQVLLELLQSHAHEGTHNPQLEALVHFQARRARVWFERGLALVERLDRRSGACVLAMSGIYRHLLEEIDGNPACALRQRTSLPMHQKTVIAAKALLGVGV